MKDSVTVDHDNYHDQQDQESSEEDRLITESNYLAEDWESELRDTGIIKDIGYEAKEIAGAMEELEKDFEDTLRMMAFKHLKDKRYGWE